MKYLWVFLMCSLSMSVPSEAQQCASDYDCQAGEICNNGTCAPPQCSVHYDCEQGEYCYYGKCIKDANLAIFHCGKPGCIPGRWCIDAQSQKSTCDEDPDYVCSNACDCGPAHACIEIPGLGKRCVKDVDDPWFPGGEAIFNATIPAGEPTYCCSDPECHAGRAAADSNGDVTDFRCFDIDTDSASNLCGGSICYFAGDCEAGESCADTTEGTTAAPGTSCQKEGGSCISNAVAEAVFGWKSNELLPDCASGCAAGQTCETGWTPGGAYAVQRVVDTCPDPFKCGNGVCETGESLSNCSQDCKCGDGICDTAEMGICVSDCGTCGNGMCDALETSKNCPADCGVVCGDNSCDSSEVISCPQDCGCPDSATYADYPARCGDEVCQTGGDIPEDCRKLSEVDKYIVPCPQDCELIDTDNDGAPDGCDECPSDPAKVVPGQCGCGNSDNDGDGDGVADCVDQCPQDPNDDSDGDGFCANDDNCPDIANSDQLNTDGDNLGNFCDPDDDNDTVLDNDDNCPLHPNSDQADQDRDGQGDVCDLDVDGDNVSDAVDQCLLTPIGSVVNSDGCSIAQLCPAETDWKNHGAYVKCIAHTSEKFIEAGLITEAEKGSIVSEAAASDIGHKK